MLFSAPESAQRALQYAVVLEPCARDGSASCPVQPDEHLMNVFSASVHIRWFLDGNRPFILSIAVGNMLARFA